MIKMQTFYGLGTILFSAGLVGSAVNIKYQWLLANPGIKISLGASFLFQCLLIALFYGLYIQTKKQSKVINNPALDSFLNELKNKDKLKGGLKDGKENTIKNKH